MIHANRSLAWHAVWLALGVSAPPALATLNLIWSHAYIEDEDGDQASLVAGDQNGNVIVAGQSGFDGSADVLVLKYDAAGARVWAVEYDGPSSWYDSPRAIAVDPSGDIIIAAVTYLLSPNSGQHWMTIRLDPDGNVLWERLFHGAWPFADASPADVAIDAGGNAVVVGNSRGEVSGNPTGVDIGVVKYASDGTPLWSFEFTSPGFQADTASAVVLDPAGNVYITGSYRHLDQRDVATLKLDAAGNLLWFRQYDADETLYPDDAGSDIAVDSEGHVYVSGWFSLKASQNPNFGHALGLLKYDAGGTLLWAQHDLTAVDGASLALREDGGVVVSGRGVERSTQILAAFGPGGEALWSHAVQTDIEQFSARRVLALDQDGGVNLLITRTNPGNGRDVIVRRYSSAGEFLGEAALHEDAVDVGGAIAAGPTGDLLITGYTNDGVGSDSNILTGRLTLAGPSPLPGDINDDGVVNIDDLLAVIAAWGPCPAPPPTCAADVTIDGVVNIDDLLLVIANWG